MIGNRLRIAYVLLSPTFGMHQYTADLCNRTEALGYEVHLVTTQNVPRDRYSPEVNICTPATTTVAGFSSQCLDLKNLVRVMRVTFDIRPDLVHITGPHPWNPLLLRVLRRARVPTVHTIHDQHPHLGSAYGRLLYLWNGWVKKEADHLLVHSQRHQQDLLQAGIPPSRSTCTLLTHLFLSHSEQKRMIESLPPLYYEPWAFFLGRLEFYKGLHVLIEAAKRCGRGAGVSWGVKIAGSGQLDGLINDSIASNVQVHEGLVGDRSVIDLVSKCGLMVLPYVEASQSALIAASYFFYKPVVATNVGALPEYVVHGETGWVVPPNDPQALSATLQTALADTANLVQMGLAGRDWYERHRMVETVALKDMYAKVLNISRFRPGRSSI